MEFVFISDTHGLHRELESRYGELPKGDCIIHAGDVSNIGLEHQLKDFVDWFSSLPYKYKIFIAGNHDAGLMDDDIKKRILEGKDCIYLEDSGVEIEGFRIWGMPWTPEFGNWYFMKRRGAGMGSKTFLIPMDTDILITHGPPFGRLDFTKNGYISVGCESTRERVQSVRPLIHVFGHIHEDGGRCVDEQFKTTSINASVLNENYFIKNPIISWDSESDSFYNTNPKR